MQSGSERPARSEDARRRAPSGWVLAGAFAGAVVVVGAIALWRGSQRSALPAREPAQVVDPSQGARLQPLAEGSAEARAGRVERASRAPAARADAAEASLLVRLEHLPTDGGLDGWATALRVTPLEVSALPGADLNAFLLGRVEAPATSAEFAALEPGRWRVESSLGHDVEVELEAGRGSEVALDCSQLSVFRVRAIDDRGDPVPGASVVFRGLDVGKTGEGGEFAIRSVASGGDVHAVAPGYLESASVSLDRYVPPPTLLQLWPVPSSTLVLRLEPGSTDALRAQVEVCVVPGSRRSQPQFDFHSQADRRFLVVTDAASVAVHGIPERSWVRVTALAQQVRATEVHWIEELPFEVTLQMEPSLALEGRVVGDTGAPEIEAFVGSNPIGTFGYRFSKTDRSGRFVLAGLSPETTSLEVMASDGTTSVHELTVAEVGPDGLTLVHSRGRTIEGIVVDDAGVPMSGAQVVAVADEQSDRWLSHAATDVDGRFVLAGLPQGDFFCAVRGADASARLGGEWVREEETEVLVVISDPSGFVSLRARDPEGRELPSAKLAYEVSPGRRLHVRAEDGSSGRFRLPPGTHDLSLLHDSLGQLQLGPIDVRSGATTELGEVQFRPPAYLQLELPRAPVEGRAWSLSVRSAEDEAYLWYGDARAGATVLAGPFQPGVVAIDGRNGDSRVSQEVTLIGGVRLPLTL